MHQRDPLKTQDIEQIKSLYSQFKTLTKVAKELDISIEKLRKFCIVNNIEYAKRQKYTCNENFFSEETEKTFYWAGFIAADGNIDKDSNRLSITLETGDKNHLEKFKNDINSDTIITDFSRADKREKYHGNISNGSILRISSNIIKNDLKKFNIVPAKSANYTIPQWLSEHEYFNHFLRGLIDGDGGIWQKDKEQHGVVFLCGTIESMKFIFEYLKNKLELEVKPKSFNIVKTKKNLATLTFKRLKDVNKIINYLYNDATISLNRKRETAEKILLCVPRKIEFTKEQLIKAMHINPEHLAMGKYLNTSNSTIKRRLIELNLIDYNIKLKVFR